MPSQPPSSIRWDMTRFFTRLGGEDYELFVEDFAKDVAAQNEELAVLGKDLKREKLDAWSSWLLQREDLLRRGTHLWSYIHCLCANDAKNEEISAQKTRFQSIWNEYEKGLSTLRIVLGAAEETSFHALVGRPELESARFYLGLLRTQGQHSMTPEQERLAADLSISGMQAWGNLYGKLTGTITFEMEEHDGSTKTVPLSQYRSFLEHPNAATRKAAFQGANREFDRFREVFAATLNSIAGTRLTLQRWRGVEDFLMPSLRSARTSRATLDAMHEAILASQEIPRAYLRAKAKLMGREKLGFQDLSAPVPTENQQPVPWEDACARIIKAFQTHHPRMGEFAKLAIEENWVDAFPRDGRSPGGFCTTSQLNGESRIFMTYCGRSGDIQTLAHELGHAFHSYVMRDLRPWQRRYPMTLAETASTYAETVLTDAVINDPSTSEQDRLVILDTALERAAAFMLNIPMRFFFEEAFYEERAKGPVSVSKLQDLMRDAQRASYGDTLAEDEMGIWFWASKMHFHMTGTSFYNYPYSFGYLFSLGVLAHVRSSESADPFQEYVDLLRMTGNASVEEVARKSLGVDLTQTEFWLNSIKLATAGLPDFLKATGLEP